MRNSGCDVPEWMLSLKAPTQNAKKQLRRRPVERKDVSQAVGSVGKKRKPSKAQLSKNLKKSKVSNGQEDEQSQNDSFSSDSE
jgi:ATP-dependent RNA helicase DDX52/ROK1